MDIVEKPGKSFLKKPQTNKKIKIVGERLHRILYSVFKQMLYRQ